MRRRLTEHIISILFIAILFCLIGFFLGPASDTNQIYREATIYFNIINPDDPLDKLLLKESLDLFYPTQAARNDSVLQILSGGAENIFNPDTRNIALTKEKVLDIIYMYLKFIIIFIIVLILTYLGAQKLAIFKFIKMQQKRSSYILLIVNQIRSGNQKSIRQILGLVAKAIFKGFIYFILFSPAYVIAYSFKTRFDTDSVFFMILLGIISNGLLISYAQKFYTFLMAESRRGYVNTARVKNLKNSYHTKDPDGIAYRDIFRLNKSFDGHVFQHIYKNSRFQFILSIKEQASFLISGLVIIEMALNIQGHLCYELMQNILFQNIQAVLLIVFLIFLLLKITELYCDYIQNFYSNKFENIP